MDSGVYVIEWDNKSRSILRFDSEDKEWHWMGTDDFTQGDFDAYNVIAKINLEQLEIEKI